MEHSPQEAREVLAWMRRLPLWLNLEGLRIVHASWSSRAIAALRPHLDPDGAFTDEGLVRAAQKDDPVRSAREILLNGIEATPPGGRSVADADGHMRSEVRLKWWRAGEPRLTWRGAALVPDSVLEAIPDTPLPKTILEWFDTGPVWWRTASKPCWSTRSSICRSPRRCSRPCVTRCRRRAKSASSSTPTPMATTSSAISWSKALRSSPVASAPKSSPKPRRACSSRWRLAGKISARAAPSYTRSWGAASTGTASSAPRRRLCSTRRWRLRSAISAWS
jgi:hypothetical protein